MDGKHGTLSCGKEVLFQTDMKNITDKIRRIMSNIMEAGAKENMQTTLNAKTKVIEKYIEQIENLLTAYTQAPVVRELLGDTENETLAQKAEDYTLQYYGSLNSWEGIYIGDWNTKVLTHPAKPVIG